MVPFQHQQPFRASAAVRSLPSPQHGQQAPGAARPPAEPKDSPAPGR